MPQHSPHIRQARPDELEAIRAIEIDCAAMFVEAGVIPSLEAAHPSTIQQLEVFRENGLLFVSEHDGALTGFLAARVVDSALYIAEIDVLRARQQRGIGRTLMEAARQEAVRRGLDEITLTTDRSLAWNGPWYLRLAFQPFEPGATHPALAAQLAVERRHHSPPERRIAMRRETASSFF